jgi:hypothetical protein
VPVTPAGASHLADKRWRRGRASWVTPAARFDARAYAVDVVEQARAKAFVVEHHYAGSYPAARLAVGLFGAGAGGHAQLVGVAVFSQPMNQQVIPAHTGLAPAAGTELGRFVCLDSVLFNGESWFLPRAFALLAAEKDVAGVVSYADPLERRTAAGVVYKRQHWGTIYQATNALFVGRSSPRRLLLAPSGQVVSDRSLSKIRQEERGWRYASAQLMAAGAPPRAAHEEAAAWVARVERTPGFRRVRHDGNLTYVFGLTRSSRRTIAARHAGGLPYPRPSHDHAQEHAA